MAKKKNIQENDIALKHFNMACATIESHPMFAPLWYYAHVNRNKGNKCPEKGWAVVTKSGWIHVHPTRRGDPEEWIYVIAHCLLHLGLGHFQEKQDLYKWNVACDAYIARFLGDMKLGREPSDLHRPLDLYTPTEDQLYQQFQERDIPLELSNLSLAGASGRDMIFDKEEHWYCKDRDWSKALAEGLTAAVTSAVNVAGGYESRLGAAQKVLTAAARAKNWFVSSYPLLGALAASFALIEDPALCMRLEISVAAINPYLQEIYVNSAAGLSEQECRFIMAHEFLHVGLMHHVRCQGRDFYLWNVACDYVINSWLIEMGLGEVPKLGLLYDPDLKGLSAESIYDRMATDMRKYRKLATLRGIGLGDLLGKESGAAAQSTIFRDLEEFYRRALGQGLVYHEDQGRGLLPAGLVEEIRAQSQPPVPWDVELAQWFDNYFSPLEKVRSYARPSRRQSSTPGIPKPSWVPKAGAEDCRTFGVVLDTSGSMNRVMLAKALGAIASYSLSREVPLVRVVFCDAVTYDQGYMAPEAIAGSVKVRGRGGTILQPGVDLLESAKDFPEKGPLLIITDGDCDPLRIRREHAFLIPKGKHLPFVPKGKVFRFE